MNYQVNLRANRSGGAQPQPAAEPQSSSVAPDSPSGAKAAGFSFTPTLKVLCWAGFGGAVALAICAAAQHVSVYGWAKPALQDVASSALPTLVIFGAFTFGGIGWLLGYISASLKADALSNADADAAGMIPRKEYVEVVGALAQAKGMILAHHNASTWFVPPGCACPVCEPEEGNTDQFDRLYVVLDRAQKRLAKR